MLKVIFLVEGELSFAFFCPFGYIPHPLDAPSSPGDRQGMVLHNDTCSPGEKHFFSL
jgi:hypothetical protein